MQALKSAAAGLIEQRKWDEAAARLAELEKLAVPDEEARSLRKRLLEARQREEQERAAERAAAERALQLQAELSLWESIRDSGTIEPLEDYLGKYPDGRFVSAARDRIRELQAASLESEARRLIEDRDWEAAGAKLQALEKLVPAGPSAGRPAPAAPASGRLIWTGALPRNGQLVFTNGQPSEGSVSGSLPDGPFAVRILPAEITEDGLTIYTADPARSNAIEAPARQNGWLNTRYRLDINRTRSLQAVELPGPGNQWRRFAARNAGGPLTILVVDWERSGP